MKEYKAIIVYENGGHTSFPTNVSSKKELLEHVLKRDIYVEEIVSITLIVNDDE